MRAPALSPQVKPDFIPAKGRVWIMGVLNVTPDSFYPGSRTPDVSHAVSKAETMISEGADILDIGGESTRPGAPAIPQSVELERVIPVVEALSQRWPGTPLSIDTQKAEVARQAFAHGARVINDVSALRHDADMASIIAENGGGVVLMHMQGTPDTMQQNPHYNDVMDELKAFFEERLAFAVRQGIAEETIWLDPGIGFGKTLEHNLAILKRLSEFRCLGRPLLLGLSRKSFLGKIQGDSASSPEQRLEGSLAAALWAVQQGVDGLRVHDVGATRQAIDVWRALQSTPT